MKSKCKLIRPVIFWMSLMLAVVFAGSTWIVKINKTESFQQKALSYLNNVAQVRYPELYRNYVQGNQINPDVNAKYYYREYLLDNTNKYTAKYSLEDELKCTFVYYDATLKETFCPGNYLYGIWSSLNIIVDMTEQFGISRTEEIVSSYLDSMERDFTKYLKNADGYIENVILAALDNTNTIKSFIFEEYEYTRYPDRYNPSSHMFAESVKDEYTGKFIYDRGGYFENGTESAWFHVTNTETVDTIILGEDDAHTHVIEMNITAPVTILIEHDKKDSMKYWKEWMNDADLQKKLSYAKQDIDYLKTYTNDHEMVSRYPVTYGNSQIGTVLMIASYHPWIAAFRQLKWFYLFGTLLTLLCMYLISRSTIRSYELQKETDEVQRSYTNAIAHELKTPLAAVKGYTENLQDTGNPEKREEYLSKILSKGEEMNDMITEIIDMSKLDSTFFEMEYKELDAVKLIRDDLQYLEEEKARSGLSVSLRGEDEFILIGDEKYLGKMFRNILENAVSYAKEGSEIVIRTDKNSIEIFNESDPIPEDKLKEIFRFSSKKGNAKGHYGFGLYFAKKVADAHKLKLSVSNKNSGVSVKIER